MDGIPSEDGHVMVIGAVNVMPLKCLMKDGPLMLVFLSRIFIMVSVVPILYFFYLSTSPWTSLHWIGLSVNIRKQNILVRTSESI